MPWRALRTPPTMKLPAFLHRDPTRRAFRERLNGIPWSRYRTAYGSSLGVPHRLFRFRFSGRRRAAKAGHELWCGLCHQHAYVSSAALPALPFILEVLDRPEPVLVTEALDILRGFALCTEPGPATEDWHRNLRREVEAQLPRICTFAASEHPDVAEEANALLIQWEEQG